MPLPVTEPPTPSASPSPRQSLLARSLPPGVLHQEVQFDRFEEGADGSHVTLHFKGGRPPLTARLVVGADGGQSGVRQQVLGDGPPLYQGERGRTLFLGWLCWLLVHTAKGQLAYYHLLWLPLTVQHLRSSIALPAPSLTHRACRHRHLARRHAPARLVAQGARQLLHLGHPSQHGPGLQPEWRHAGLAGGRADSSSRLVWRRTSGGSHLAICCTRCSTPRESTVCHVRPSAAVVPMLWFITAAHSPPRACLPRHTRPTPPGPPTG